MRSRLLPTPSIDPRKLLPAQNQIVSGFMRTLEARRHDFAPASSALAGVAVARLTALLMLAACLAAGGVLLVYSGAVDTAVLVVLGAFAAVGFFCVFGWLAGFVRINENAAETELARAAADSGEVAVQIVSADGTVAFTNGVAHRLFGLGAGTIEDALAADPHAAEAVFRLTRAAERGETRIEDIRMRPVMAPAAKPRWFRVGVRPCTPGAAAEDGAAMALWHVQDVSADRNREAEAVRTVEQSLRFYETMPVGIFAMQSDGRIAHINATLTDWLGLKPDALRNGLSIADLMPPDSSALVEAIGRSDGATARLDIDLVREDGRVLPVRLICRGADRAGSGLVTILVLEGQAHDQVRAEETVAVEHFTRVLNGAPVGIATLDRAGTIQSSNAAFARMFPNSGGQAAAEGQPLATLLGRVVDAEQKKQIEKALERSLSGRATASPVELAFGTELKDTRRLYLTSLSTGPNRRDAAIVYVVDTSEQKALELKFAQSQKMEAVGKLAGGIAHDFNNVLTVIIGLSDLLLGARRPTDAGYNDMMQIKQNANRAAGMVRQLLAFSRKQTLAPETLALNDLIQDFGYSLNRLLGEKIELKHAPGRDLWYVKADRHQFEQVLINLTVNARDAMPAGGRLGIRTRNLSERESLKLAAQSVVAGEYVAVEVEDTGEGMSADVMARIFEPFFSTKDVGKGTGLGLSTVYGIVKQTGGYIFVDSTLAKGTTFRVLLPRHIPENDEEIATAKGVKKKEPVRDLTGTGRVLLVEDEDAVRSFAVRALQRQGYEVLEAATGAEALEVMAQIQGEVDLIVSDVIMPEMDGPTMLREIRKTHPDLPIIFVSGYPDDAFKKSLDENERFGFLQKPFTLPQLAAKVKEQMGR